jgi:tetratricopeptide (TPR) repeat protein
MVAGLERGDDNEAGSVATGDHAMAIIAPTFIVCLIVAAADDSTGRTSIQAAQELFRAGKFADAEKIYSRNVDRDPKEYEAVVGLGNIALLSNQLETAQKWLENAIRLKPDETRPKQLLAEVFFRRDDFERAAPLLRTLGREAAAKTLESFHSKTPYEIQGPPAGTALKFVVTDPLPLIRIKVNESEEVNFLIDTGAAEIILDTEFAKQVGAKLFGSETGSFAGGKRAAYEHARIDALTLGDIFVRNVPVGVMDTRRFSGIFGGKRVDGILGTVLLKHFLATLDYPAGRLVLERPTPQALARYDAAVRAGTSAAIPIWMAGDHYMVAWGTLDKSKPVLLFVDTGLAGGGVTCAESLLKVADIRLAEDQAGEGIGGGGKVKVVPFVVKSLTLGTCTEKDVRGFFSGSFPLEFSQGFRIAGIISHGFFRPYALTFDFTGMRLLLRRK